MIVNHQDKEISRGACTSLWAITQSEETRKNLAPFLVLMPYLATRNLACQMEFFKYPQGMFCTCSSGREPRGGIWRGRGWAFGIKKIGTEYVLQTFRLSHWNGPIRALPNWRALKYPPPVFKVKARGCRPQTGHRNQGRRGSVGRAITYWSRGWWSSLTPAVFVRRCPSEGY